MLKFLIIAITLTAFFFPAGASENEEKEAIAWVESIGGIPPGEGIGAAKWIWYPEIAHAMGKSVRFFRYEFDLAEKPEQAELLLCFDDAGTLFVNGAEVNAKIEYSQPPKPIMISKYDLTARLSAGRNVIAFRVENFAAEGGVIATLDLTARNGQKRRITTGSGWKSSQEEEPGFAAVGFDDSAWQPVWIIGDAMIHPWSNLTNAPTAFLTARERLRHEILERSMQNIGTSLNLAAEPDSVAQIAWNGKQTGIEINGKIIPPLFHLVWHQDRYSGVFLPRNGEAVSLAGKAGIDLVQYALELSSYMPEPGKWNSDYVKNCTRSLNRLLAANHNARLVFSIDFRAPEWWLNAHPGECVGYVTGPAKFQEDAINRVQVASMASDLWRQEALIALEKLLEEFKKELWWKRVVGFRIGYGVYAEWHYYGMSRHMPDISDPMTRRFRQYLGEKYKNDAALRQAWQDQAVTLETAAVPGKTERENQGRFMRTPADGNDRRTMDYYDCQQKVTAGLLLDWAGGIKRLAPGKLVGAWYGYIFEMSYPADGQTVEYDLVLSSPNIDFLSSPYCYSPLARKPGGDGQMRIISAPFNRYGKLAFFEEDSRTHLAGAPHVLDAATPEESVAILKRNLGICLINRIGLQFNNGGDYWNIRGWFTEKGQLETIRRAGEIWQELWQDKRPVTHGEVAVIYDPRETIRHNHTAHPIYMLDALSDCTLHAMRQTGYSIETFTMEDYLQLDHPFKLAVMLNTFSPSAEERVRLKQKLQRDGTTAVWIYAPGFMTENDFSDAAMTELTGIKLTGRLKKLPLAIVLDDESLMQYSTAVPLVENPRIQIADPAADIWGRYADDSSPALAIKEMPDRRQSIFSGAPITEKSVWSRIYRQAGIHRYSVPGAIVYSNGTQLLIHVGKAGTYPVIFPQKGKIVELFSGQVLTENADSVTLQSTGADTWLLDLY